MERPAPAHRRRHPHAPCRASARSASRRSSCSSRSACSRARRRGSTPRSPSSPAGATSSSPTTTPPTALARRIGRTMPIIYGGGGIGQVAALRWKAQFNENAKVPAFANVIPELCHNEVCGWGQNGDVTRQVMHLVNLRHEFEHPQIARRFDLVTEAVDEVVADVDTVVAEGDGAARPAARPDAVRRLRDPPPRRPGGPRPRPRPDPRRDQGRPRRRVARGRALHTAALHLADRARSPGRRSLLGRPRTSRAVRRSHPMGRTGWAPRRGRAARRTGGGRGDGDSGSTNVGGAVQVLVTSRRPDGCLDARWALRIV